MVNNVVLKKWVPILLAFAMLLSGLVPTIGTNGNFGVTEGVAEASSAPTVNIGNYIQFGKYNNAPILWRVINKEADGNPILLADRILTLKAFDTKGNYHAGNSERVDVGSNYYKDSNIRQWINSSSPNSGANVIDWIQNDPNVANSWNGHNPYNSEKGFLAEGNFSSTERSLIKPYTHKVLLASVDQAKKDGGSTNHTYNTTLATIVQNYDTTAYFQNVTDSIFLLSVKQLKEWVYDNRGVLGTSYHKAKPTAEAVTQSTYKDAQFLNNTSNWYYFLNSPYAGYSNFVRYLPNEDSVTYFAANNSVIGIRPALQLSYSSVIFAPGGTGTSSNPYVVTGAVPPDSAPPSVPTNLIPSNIGATSLTLDWTTSTDNVGVTAYEIYSGTTLLATVAGSGVNPPATTYTLTGLSQGTSYTLNVKARDAVGNRSDASDSVSITTKYGPTAPVLSATTVVENSPINTVIGTLSSTDADSAVPVTFSLVSGSGSANNSSFSIDGNELRTSATIDFETIPTYNIRVRATDNEGFFAEQTFTVTVNNVNEAPSSLSSTGLSVSENLLPGAFVGRLTTIDEDASDSATYSLVTGTGDSDNGSFTIDGSVLKTAAIFDYKTKSSYSIRVRVTDAGSLTYEQSLTVNVTEVFKYLLSGQSNRLIGSNNGFVDDSLTIPITLSAITPTTSINGASVLIGSNFDSGKDTLSYTGTLPSGVTATTFNSTTGLLRFNGSTTPANWQALLRSVKFTTTSASSKARKIHFTLGTALPLEQANGTIHLYEYVNTSTNWSAAKTAAEARKAGGVVDGYLATLNSKSEFDFLNLHFSGSTGWLGASDDVNTVNSAFGKTTETGFANQSAVEGKYHWVTGPTDERAMFSQGNSPNVVIESGQYGKWRSGEPNNASNNEHYAEFFSVDGFNDLAGSTNRNYFTEYYDGIDAITATVTLTDGPPTDIALSKTTFSDALNAGAKVATLNNTDPLPNDTFSYQLVSGTGDTDNGKFMVDGTTLRLNEAVNASTQSTFNIRVSVTDSSNFSFEEALTLTAVGSTKYITASKGLVTTTLAATAIDSGLVVNGSQSPWTGSNSITSATVMIADNFESGKDSLSFSGSVPTGSGISVSTFDTTTGVLRFNGSTTAANWQTILRAVKYTTTSTTTKPRTLYFTIGNAIPFQTSAGAVNYYEHVPTSLSWTAAKTAAEARQTAGVLNGHLATMNEAAENEFLKVQFNKGGWLGGTDDVGIINTATGKNTMTGFANQAAAEGKYHWIGGAENGTLFSTGNSPNVVTASGQYSNWRSGEPNNSGSVEHYAEFTTTGWNDLQNTNNREYFVEYNGSNVALTTSVQVYLNAAPTDIALSSTSIAENAGSNAVVGTLSATDANTLDTATYSLVSGTGDTENASFNISGSSLRANESFDYESKSSYSIRVRVMDSAGATFEKSFTIDVTDDEEAPTNQAPTDISLSAGSLAENAGTNMVVGSLSATDSDAGDTATFTLVSGTGSTDNAAFNISGTSLRANASFDFETKASYSVRVRVTDSGSLTFEKTFTINVTDVDDTAPTAPTGLASSLVTATSATVSWTASTDNVGVTGYEVYNGATLVGTTTGATSSNLTGLVSGSTNNITVVAVDEAGNKSSASSSLTVPLIDVIAPSIPTGFSSSNVTQSGFTVSWTASTDNRAVKSYNVYRNGTYVANVSTNNYKFSGLTASTTYNIRVLAIDTSNNRSLQSLAYAVTTSAPTDVIAPSTPSSLTATSVLSNRILLTWTPSTDNVGVTGYNVYVNNVYLKTVTTSQTDLTGLTSLTTYSIQVQALDAMKNRSARSTALNVTTKDGQAPTVPTGLASSSITKTGFKVTWTPSTDNVGVKSYNVYRNGAYIATIGATTTSYTFSNLSLNQTHLVRIMAIDEAGNKSAQSTDLSVATTFVADPTPPSAPSNLTSSNVTKTGVRVTWTAATDNVAVTNYNIYRNGTYVATVSGTTTSYNFAGLTAGTSYSITVRALDAAKNFTNSTALSVTTLP